MDVGAGLLGSILSITLMDLVLSGDNAVVIALATLRLGEKERRKAIFWGTFGAIALRVSLTTIAVMLLAIPFVQVVGGLLLAWIAVKLLLGDEDESEVKEASSLRAAIQTIIIADFLMSLDNVLAVAGASQGNISLLIFGLFISIPIVVFGSTFLSSLMKKWSWLVSLGAGLLGYTAGEMLLNDSYFHFLAQISILDYLIPGALGVGLVIVGNLLRIRREKGLESKEADEKKKAG